MNRKSMKIWMLAVALLALASCSSNLDNPATDPSDKSPFVTQTLGDKLKTVSNLASMEAFTPKNASEEYQEFYEVFFNQPIDHNNPSAGTMRQKALIFFKGFDRPTVMYTSGYNVSDGWKNMGYLDIAYNMDANLIIVEHRYFGDSKNLNDTRWDYLTIEQAAADHHAIFQALKPLLPKEWVSTGTSKDGMTSLFYRYFYPDDMTVTTVFCSPFMTSLYYLPVGTYLDNESGSDAERENMHNLYYRLLGSDEVYATYEKMCNDYNAKILELHPEQKAPFYAHPYSYVYSLASFFFTQFSYNTAKERALNIPSATADSTVILDYIYFRAELEKNGLWRYNSPMAPAEDKEDYYWKGDDTYPYYIQTAKQLGQFTYDFSRYESLMGGPLPVNDNPSGLFEQDTWLYSTYDNTKMKDIRENFIPNTDRPILFYYAQGDPWTGARPDKINKEKSMLLIGQRGVHNQDLNNPEHFSAEDKQQIMDFLARYVDYANATTARRRSQSGNLPTAPIAPDDFIIRR